MNDLHFQSRIMNDGGTAIGRRPAVRRDVLWQQASHLFWRIHSRARLARLWSFVNRHPRRLMDLNRLCCPACHQFYAGVQTVPMAQIRGSEGRTGDFDSTFRPLTSRSRERWIRIAVATLQGTVFPAVQLIQVGDVYFVRDGHHRISVARALGQDFIDAEVTVWEGAQPVADALPVHFLAYSVPTRNTSVS